MNIFFLTETNSGCYRWRSAIPAKYLRRRGHTVQILSDSFQAYEAPDVIVIFRAHYPDVHRLVEWSKQRKIRVVFDTDDALDRVPKENIHYRELQGRLGLYSFLLENADVVTTTTPVLAADLRQRNPNVVVLPNSADPEEWSVRPRGDDLRVGWTGSATHFHDLAVALPAIREVQKRHPFTLVLQGLCDRPDLAEFYSGLVASHGKPFVHSPLGKSIKRLVEELSSIRYEFHSMDSVLTACGKGVRTGVEHRDRTAGGRYFQSQQELHQVLRVRALRRGYGRIARATVFDGSFYYLEE